MTSVPDFDDLYTGDPDPWQVATSWYERRKIDVVLACLRRQRYRRAWDAGCGTGELAAALAARCDHVLATDRSTAATTLARRRLAGTPARVETSGLPHRPNGLAAPDLIVLSEVLYYLDHDQRRATYELLDAVAAPGADLVIVHWAPHADDAHLSGLAAYNEASSALNAAGWGRVVTHTDAEFLVGVFSTDVPDAVGGREEQM